MRLTRTGNTYSFYYKQNEGDEWTLLRTHPRAWTPYNMYLGFGIDNHNGCNNQPAAIGKFANLTVTDSTGDLDVTPPAPLSIYGITAARTPQGAHFTWSADGGPDHFIAVRTFNGVSESLALPGVLREVIDDTAPVGFVSYKLTPTPPTTRRAAACGRPSARPA